MIIRAVGIHMTHNEGMCNEIIEKNQLYAPQISNTSHLATVQCENRNCSDQIRTKKIATFSTQNRTHMFIDSI